ncbi:MAG: histidine kinase dimerization/phospho-acceptor domain-containing protein, partial [Patescibacteria group bacterium]|nr:histidine kinase dimerization/phospho-acceptor domain-containing protein [Patescibacteria group bacterium]
MDFTIFLPLLSALLVFFLGVLVLRQGLKKRINFTFALFAFAITIWMFGTFMMFLKKDNPADVIFWDKFVYVGVVFIPAIMFHFGLALTESRVIRGKFLLVLGYLTSFIFLLLIPGELFVKGAFIYKWGAHSQAQVFHHIFLGYFFVYILLWFIIVYKYYRLSISSIERERTKYCFLAFIILATFGSLGYLPAYGIGIYPFAYVSGVIFTIILAYAIIVHRLMDIKLVMRRYSVYLASLSSVIILATVVKYVLIIYFVEVSLWTDFIILTLAILAFPKIKDYFYRLGNKYFFSSLYDSREVIADISDKLRTTLEVRRIYDFIYESLNNALHFKTFGILGYSEKEGYYLTQYNKGFSLAGQKKFLENEELHKMFISRNEAIVVEEIKHSYYNRETKETIDLLESLKVDVLVPLNVKDKTIGLMSLGAKESGDMYNDEDLKVLKVVSAQAAIAIENALLYEETLNFTVKLKKEVAKATHDLKIANEELKKLDEAKSDFISIASHQLRTPLTVIKGYISMMLEGNFGELTPPERDSLEKVYESGERLIRLVENLLNISRIESGRLQFNYELMSLEEIIDSVIGELSGPVKKKGLRLDYKKPDEPLPKLKIDEEKIRQVVMNLIDNAVKYTKRGGITVSLKKAGKNIQFCVSDSGMGIGKEDLPNLFKKFSRGSGTSTIHTEGTGL